MIETTMKLARRIIAHARRSWREAREYATAQLEARLEKESRAFDTAEFGRASISHTVIRACPRCLAPGLFRSEPRIREGWSGCYVEPGDERDGKPVGAHCPNCGAPRGTELIEERGVVWRGTI